MSKQGRAYRKLFLHGRAWAGLVLCLQMQSLPRALAQAVLTQQPSTQQSNPHYSRPSMADDPMNGPGNGIQPNPLKLEHFREDERQKRLQADVAKLLALTNELKAEVDKTSRDELSLDVVRKAAEIEKLARDVKDRMKN